MSEEGVEFKESIFNDANIPITLEGAIRTSAAFSGIHAFDFQDAIDENFANLSDWTTDALATWAAAGNQLDATGGGSAIWYQAIHDTEVEPSFVASFDLVSGVGAFVFRAKTSANDCYIAWWDASNCGFARVAADKTGTDLIKMPYGIASAGKIQVHVKWKLNSVDGDRKWLLMSLFVDGQEFCSYADDIGGTASDWAGDGVGFAVTASNNLVVDDFTISELSRVADYLSIDPGETPGQGMARAIGSTRVAYMGRWDGTMRVWRPGNRASDWTIPQARVLRIMERENKRDALTHIRTIGVIHAVDRFDDSEGDVHMHRFAQMDDPNLMSETETYAEAGLQLNDAIEEQTTYQIVIAYQPLIEPHDRITIDGTDYRVSSINSSMVATQQGLQYVSIVEARRYIAV